MNKAINLTILMLLLQTSSAFADTGVEAKIEPAASGTSTPLKADGRHSEINVQLANNDERDGTQSWSDLWE